MADAKRALIERLQKDILQWEGYKPPVAGAGDRVGLGIIEAAFPNGIFPVGAVHELVCANAGQVAASEGFIGGLLSELMREGVPVCGWVCRKVCSRLRLALLASNRIE